MYYLFSKSPYVLGKFFSIKTLFFQELQRRLDQTLGKPGNYHHGIDREGHVKPMTIGARLYRLENQVYMKNSFEELN